MRWTTLVGTTQQYDDSIKVVPGGLHDGTEMVADPDGLVFEEASYWRVVVKLIDEQKLPTILR